MTHNAAHRSTPASVQYISAAATGRETVRVSPPTSTNPHGRPPGRSCGGAVAQLVADVAVYLGLVSWVSATPGRDDIADLHDQVGDLLPAQPSHRSSAGSVGGLGIEQRLDRPIALRWR